MCLPSIVVVLALMGLIKADLMDLSCDDIKDFVDGHNKRRLLLAKGMVRGQPAASNMQSMVWDDELAEKAANWAAKEDYQHNPDKSVPSDRFRTGENLYRFRTTDMDHDFDLDEALEAWFEEVKDFEFKPLVINDFTSPILIGHYTQMAWASSILVGCAISNYHEGKWNTFLVVCNYGPSGNMLGESPYETGDPRHSLLCRDTVYVNCDELYGSHCSKKLWSKSYDEDDVPEYE